MESDRSASKQGRPARPRPHDLQNVAKQPASSEKERESEMTEGARIMVSSASDRESTAEASAPTDLRQVSTNLSSSERESEAEASDLAVRGSDVELLNETTTTENESNMDDSNPGEEDFFNQAVDEELSDYSCSTCGNCDSEEPAEGELQEMLRNLNEQNTKNDITAFSVRAGITTLLHPSQMAQILMQIGYEPFPPRRSVTLLGRPCLLLPSTAGYLRYIYQVDGIRGIFRGLTPRIAHQILFTYIFDNMRCFFRRMHVNYLINKSRSKEATFATLRRALDEANGVNESDTSEFGLVDFLDHFRDVFHDLGSKIVGIVVSYPIHVVVVRTVAQFVGREFVNRRGFLGEILAIYKDFGIGGFYRGIVPKLLGETCQTLAVGVLAYLVSNQAPAAEVRSLLNVSFSILVSAWTYQFSVVSATMAVNGSCLQVGRPPMQPLYGNWVHCWKDLGKLNLLNRGSSFICRYYTGPTMLVSGVKQPFGIYFGPNHLTSTAKFLA